VRRCPGNPDRSSFTVLVDIDGNNGLLNKRTVCGFGSGIGVGDQHRRRATLTPGGGNPIEGRRAYSGRSTGFPARQSVTLDFGMQFAGQLVQLRFRAGSDGCCSTASGWTIDDISVSGITNTLFPGYVAEPTRCTAPTPAGVAASEGILAIRTMPRHSLGGVAGATE
jgi:hypothetical protein